MPGHAASSSHCLPPRVSDESSGEKVRDEEEDGKKEKEKKQKKTGKEKKTGKDNKDSKGKEKKKPKKEKPLFDAEHEPLGGGSNDEDDGDDGDEAESETIPRDLRPKKRPAANQAAKKKPAAKGGKKRDDDENGEQERLVMRSDMPYVLYHTVSLSCSWIKNRNI